MTDLSILAKRGFLAAALLITFCLTSPLQAADVFIRFRVTEPSAGRCKVTLGGFGHAGVWGMPDKTIDVDAGQWSDWSDLGKWPLHGRMDRVGGLAEWPSGKLHLSPTADGKPVRGCAFDVQLADKADPDAVVI